MSSQVLSTQAKYKSTLPTVVTSTVTPAQFSVLTLAQLALATPPIIPTNRIIPRPDNLFVQADPNNTDTVVVSNSTDLCTANIGYLLFPGQSVSLPTTNPLNWWYRSLSGSQILEIQHQFGVT